MIRILYVTSTLKRSGPINQLYGLVRNLDRDAFKPYVLTLSPESDDSRWKDFEALGATVQSLNLSRILGAVRGSKVLRQTIAIVQPGVIHTQGIRADRLATKLNPRIPIVTTIHNYAYEDYPAKYGRLIGQMMAEAHFRAMRDERHLIACSKALQVRLQAMGVACEAIQNGVDVADGNAKAVPALAKLSSPVFVTVGSLIARKNPGAIVAAFNECRKALGWRGSLVILGDGPLMDSLQAQAQDDVIFAGNVPNVPDYLAAADYLISASRSEGMPMTVLEALASGLPTILSDIEPHKEIATQAGEATRLFSLDGGADTLADAMIASIQESGDSERVDARMVGEYFSAKRMSEQYQSTYRRLAAPA